MAAHPYWTRERILEAFRAWEQKHGGPPSARDWRLGVPAHPAASTVYKRFGNWSALMRAAGHPPRVPRRPNETTREAVCQAVYRWAYDHGRLPRWRDWMHAAPGRPTADQVIRLFGSWNAAIVAAGYEPKVMYRTVEGYRKQAGHRVREASGDGLRANREARARYLKELAA